MKFADTLLIKKATLKKEKQMKKHPNPIEDRSHTEIIFTGDVNIVQAVTQYYSLKFRVYNMSNFLRFGLFI